MCKSILFTVCALLWASASLALGEVNDGVFEAEAVVKTGMRRSTRRRRHPCTVPAI
jgi:hypothetical protein